MLRKFVEYERELRHSFDLQVLDTQSKTANKRMWFISLYLQVRTLILRNAIRRDVWVADGLNVIMSLAIEPGDIIFDIGANVGWRTERVAWLAGKNGKVHSFEPSPTTCKNLLRRLVWRQDIMIFSVFSWRNWPCGIC